MVQWFCRILGKKEEKKVVFCKKRAFFKRLCADG
jgi:hypothetical protein